MARHELPAGETRADTKVKDLLQQLLEHAEGLEPSSSLQIDGCAQEVVLETRVDGTRYALLRVCPAPTPSEPRVSLSPREQEIVRLVSKGLPNKMIARVLDISPWTVATHLRRVYTKLDVNSRAEMVACALEQDLLKSDEEKLADKVSCQLLDDESG
jgi:DNA-binding CsgD family transcriptional regulator